MNIITYPHFRRRPFVHVSGSAHTHTFLTSQSSWTVFNLPLLFFSSIKWCGSLWHCFRLIPWNKINSVNYLHNIYITPSTPNYQTIVATTVTRLAAVNPDEGEQHVPCFCVFNTEHNTHMHVLAVMICGNANILSLFLIWTYILCAFVSWSSASSKTTPRALNCSERSIFDWFFRERFLKWRRQRTSQVRLVAHASRPKLGPELGGVQILFHRDTSVQVWGL